MKTHVRLTEGFCKSSFTLEFLLGASTVLWSSTNRRVGLGESQKVVAGGDHFGRILKMRKTEVGQRSPAAKRGSSYMYTLNLHPLPPRCLPSVPAAAKYSCLHIQPHTPLYLPYLGYRVVLPRVILCTHYIFPANEERESNSKRDKQR